MERERYLEFLPGAGGVPPGEGLTLGVEDPVSVESEGEGPGVLARCGGGPPGEGLTLGVGEPVSAASEGEGPGVLARCDGGPPGEGHTLGVERSCSTTRLRPVKAPSLKRVCGEGEGEGREKPGEAWRSLERPGEADCLERQMWLTHWLGSDFPPAWMSLTGGVS